MNLLPFFQWCEATSLGTAIRETTWAFAVIESVHLLALCVIGGSVLVVDLRLLGFGLRHQRINDLARDAQPWLNRSLAVMLVTGIGLFLSEPTKCYYSAPFWFKMSSLALAIMFSPPGAAEGRFSRKKDASVQSPARLSGVVSMALWLGVGAGGRWIGFSG
jgi:uncharacterized membrane protein YhdT